MGALNDVLQLKHIDYRFQWVWKKKRIETGSLRYTTQKMIYIVSFLATEYPAKYDYTAPVITFYW